MQPTELSNTYIGSIWDLFNDFQGTFTFMHLADAFIQSDLQCIQAIHFFVSTCAPWESNPRRLRC